MSDLISRSALIEQLLDAKDDEIVKAVIGLVQTQPTAYDVEKVVEEIKELRVDDNYECIDIVRNGGVKNESQ